MKITVRNQADERYQALYNVLILDEFGFSFAPWFERVRWDERYESYSVIEGGRMIANVSIFKADVLVSGRMVRAHQFGAVATRREERGKGYSRELFERVLAKYPDTPAYLAANPGVVKFYPRFGFRLIRTFRPTVHTAIDNQTCKAVKLTPDDDFLQEKLRCRRACSAVFDCANTQPAQVFHLLYDYSDGIYRLPECGAVAVARQEGETLFIADVIAGFPVAFEDIRRELPFAGVRRVEFGFCPDWLGVTPEWLPADSTKYPFFVRGEWNLPARFRFPVMSET